MLHVLLLLNLWRPAGGAAASDRAASAVTCGPAAEPSGVAPVNRTNERYDDFQRLRRLEDARARVRDAGRDEVRGLAQARERTLELARREYVRHPRPKVGSTAADDAWEKQRKMRLVQNESARRCYVDAKRFAEKSLGRGRQIPANAEFGLDE